MNPIEQFLFDTMESIANSSDYVCFECGHIDNELNARAVIFNGAPLAACQNCGSTRLSWGSDRIAAYAIAKVIAMVAERNK